jgi:hypothetical protein
MCHERGAGDSEIRRGVELCVCMMYTTPIITVGEKGGRSEKKRKEKEKNE